jgi:hypothetical protein
LASQDWLALSPNINPLEYLAKEYTLAKLSCTKHMTLAKLKTRLIKIRNEMSQQLERVPCMSFELRCQAVVRERGERF